MGDRGDGEYSAALRFCKDNYEWLLGICRSALRARGFPNYMDDGEDLAQTVCAQCGSASNDNWAAAESREAFIYTRVRWEANKLYRKRKGEPTTSLEDMTIPADRPHYKQMETALSLKEALDQLSPEKREIIKASAFEGLSVQQLAEYLQITPQTVRQRLSRARRELREVLSAADAGPPPPR
jgi:RNA polymerase sigma factor (sigma-70 family)